jgi:prophage DNA circulation protein
MTKTLTKLALTLALAAAVAVAAGAGPAAAHGGHGGYRLGAVSTTKLVNAAAKQLNVTTAKLKAAILASANARIDEALADEDIDKSEAADLKDEAADNLNVAYSLSRASTVAKELGVSTTALNDGFRAVRETLILAQIDEALAEGEIDATRAADLKAQVNAATLPGYKQSRLGGLGFGGHHR